MKSSFKRLENYIHQVDEKNKDLITESVLGINLDKYFMPSVANIIGTDLTNYKVLRNKRFACNPMHVGRDGRLPIALYQDNKPAIVSPAYFMFEINNNELDAEYLMLCFRRPLFDRLCTFKTDASVRGGISWEDLCSIEIPLPSLEEQQKIVNGYITIENRINILQQLNDKLESMALLLYKSFVKNKDNNATLKDIVKENDKSKIQVGEADLTGKYPFFTSGEKILSDSAKLVEGKNIYVNTGGKFDVKYYSGPASYSTDTLSLSSSGISILYTYLFLKANFNIIEKTCFHGCALEHLQKNEFYNLRLYVPNTDEKEQITKKIERIFNQISINKQEICSLIELRHSILTLLGKEI